MLILFLYVEDSVVLVASIDVLGLELLTRLVMVTSFKDRMFWISRVTLHLMVLVGYFFEEIGNNYAGCSWAYS